MIRNLARTMVASTFVVAGYEILRNPKPVVAMAEPVVAAVAARVPALPRNTEQAVQCNAAVQLAAGALLVAGRLPRWASLVLAGSLVPTTLAGHPYWRFRDPVQRSVQRMQFLKNLSIMGGLLLMLDAPARRTARPADAVPAAAPEPLPRTPARTTARVTIRQGRGRR